MGETLEELRASTSQGPVDQLKRAIVTFDLDLAEQASRQVVEQGIDPLRALDGMTAAIRLVGDAFGTGECWLPDLIGASEVMSTAMPTLEGEVKRRGEKRASLGTVVIGTVHGDIHSIGKTMVAALLVAEGFEVHDLGIDITAEGGW